MKKRLFFSIIYIFILTLGVQLLAYAQTIDTEKNDFDDVVDISKIELGKKVVLTDGAVLTPITMEQYVETYSKKNGISYEIALEKEKIINQSNGRAGTYYYYEYEKIYSHQDNSLLKARVIAELKIWTDGTLYRQIENVTYVASDLPAGAITVYDWRELATICEPNPNSSSNTYPCTSVRLGARGYFYASVNPGIGFEAVSLSGNVIFRSQDLKNMSATYSLY